MVMRPCSDFMHCRFISIPCAHGFIATSQSGACCRLIETAYSWRPRPVVATNQAPLCSRGSLAMLRERCQRAVICSIWLRGFSHPRNSMYGTLQRYQRSRRPCPCTRCLHKSCPSLQCLQQGICMAHFFITPAMKCLPPRQSLMGSRCCGVPETHQLIRMVTWLQFRTFRLQLCPAACRRNCNNWLGSSQCHVRA
jgi:hypothetical protein